VDDDGLDRLGPVLELLASLDGAAEVVANDWGVLRRTRRDHPTLRLVVGRLMNRMMRDPRLTGHYDTPGAPEEGLRHFRRSSLSAAPYRRLLARSGVVMAEFDPTLQGFEADPAAWGIEAALHLPFAFVATGGICTPAGLRQPGPAKFSPVTPCAWECRAFDLHLRNTRSPYEADRDLALLQKGNTLFHRVEGTALDRALEAARSQGFRRVVWAPEAPM
jgi:hypothetical protein